MGPDQSVIYPALCQQGPFQEFLHINVVEQQRNKVQREHDEGSRLHSGQVAKLCCATQMAHDLPHKKVFEDWSSTACATIFALWMTKMNEDFPCFDRHGSQERWAQPPELGQTVVTIKSKRFAHPAGSTSSPLAALLCVLKTTYQPPG